MNRNVKTRAVRRNLKRMTSASCPVATQRHDPRQRPRQRRQKPRAAVARMVLGARRCLCLRVPSSSPSSPSSRSSLRASRSGTTTTRVPRQPPHGRHASRASRSPVLAPTERRACRPARPAVTSTLASVQRLTLARTLAQMQTQMRAMEADPTSCYAARGASRRRLVRLVRLVRPRRRGMSRQQDAAKRRRCRDSAGDSGVHDLERGERS